MLETWLAGAPPWRSTSWNPAAKRRWPRCGTTHEGLVALHLALVFSRDRVAPAEWIFARCLWRFLAPAVCGCSSRTAPRSTLTEPDLFSQSPLGDGTRGRIVAGRIGAPRRSGATAGAAFIVTGAVLASGARRTLSHSFADQFANHFEKRGMYADSGGPHHPHAARVADLACFGVQVVQHFHVIRDKSDRHNYYIAARGQLA
jgi:hypothetical protein